MSLELELHANAWLSVDPAWMTGTFCVTINHGGFYYQYLCTPEASLCSCGNGRENCAHIRATKLKELPKPKPLYPFLRKKRTGA